MLETDLKNLHVCKEKLPDKLFGFCGDAKLFEGRSKSLEFAEHRDTIVG